MSAGIVTLIVIAGLTGCYVALAMIWLRKNRPPLGEPLADKIARCEGRDNPDERCPRKPRDCICWTHDE